MEKTKIFGDDRFSLSKYSICTVCILHNLTTKEEGGQGEKIE